MKNCLAMQCMHCNKWIQATSFTNHLSQCSFGDNSRDKSILNYETSNIKESSYREVVESRMTSSPGISISQSHEILTPSNNHNISNILHITVSQQTIMKDFEENKKPFTEYTVQISSGEKKWKVTKKYK